MNKANQYLRDEHRHSVDGEPSSPTVPETCSGRRTRPSGSARLPLECRAQRTPSRGGGEAEPYAVHVSHQEDALLHVAGIAVAAKNRERVIAVESERIEKCHTADELRDLGDQVRAEELDGRLKAARRQRQAVIIAAEAEAQAEVLQTAVIGARLLDWPAQDL